MNIEPSFLELLACPACRQALRPDQETEELVCDSCVLAYPVIDGVPVLLVDEARARGAAAPR